LLRHRGRLRQRNGDDQHQSSQKQCGHPQHAQFALWIARLSTASAAS
jgi:hypothetical protein